MRYFDVPARPSMEQLKALLKRTGFGEVSGSRHMDAKGIHYSSPGGGYDIHYREDLWEGTQDYSVIHETYEIVYETLCDMESGSPPDRKVCTQAERFAAAVLMQPRAFGPLALEWGLDVLKLQRAFLCSYASVTIRLAEVLKRPPLMAVLYETEDRGDPAGWTEPPELRAKVVRRTRGFGTPVFPICGYRGGIPRRGRPIPDGSPGGAGRPLRHAEIRPQRRLRRHSPPRHLGEEADQDSRRRRARKRSLRARPPGDGLRRDWAQADTDACSGDGWPLVVAGPVSRWCIVRQYTTAGGKKESMTHSQALQDPHLLPATRDGGAGAARDEGGRPLRERAAQTGHPPVHGGAGVAQTGAAGKAALPPGMSRKRQGGQTDDRPI